ncbi:uncharacterized protein LOC117653636 [Thrips palmi]|uniref:Uncharacterized protein LOC117653636 n=1 Tax=Thrips palmi TaxID=161013 RepID=A0A6P9AB56_THRPL|nr:uncharacterized protein LOC117653636 [Thrips palmi]
MFFPKKDIDEEHRPFLEAPNLDRSHIALIKDFLQSPINYTYSISSIIEKEEDLENEWMLLQRDGVLFGKLLDKVLRCLVDHLYSLVPNPNLVSPEMRESLAVSLVASFPKLAQKSREGETPWGWLYDRANNIGKIANIVQNKQRAQKEKRLRGGGTDKSKKAANKENLVPDLALLNQIPDSVLSKEAKFLKLLAANDTNKMEIIAKLKATFQERRQLILEGKYTVSAVTQVFHHLRSFRGEMVELEFRGIFSGKENEFLMQFSDVASKLVTLAEEDPVKYTDCLPFKDICLNAMLVLKKYLPKPVKCYKWENLMDPVGKVSDLIEVLPVGTNVQNSIETRRQLAKMAIQPYLLAIGTCDKVETYFIVLGDSQYVMLPRNTEAIRALDLLFKVHFVLNVHYCLAWKNVYRFIAAHIYHLPPENKRLSVFTEKWLHLTSL